MRDTVFAYEKIQRKNNFGTEKAKQNGGASDDEIHRDNTSESKDTNKQGRR